LEKAGVKDCSAAGFCVAGGVCGPVPAGFYSPSGIDACIGCEGSQAGATSCDSCSTAGFCFVTIPGTQNVKECSLSPPGYYGPAGQDDCQVCESSNSYGDDGTCTPSCESATECLTSGRCETTPPGYYSYKSTSQCVPCPTASAPGSTTCPILLEQIGQVPREWRV
jgi:hypothetical protein